MPNCITCSKSFVRTGRNHKYCAECARDRCKESIKAWAYKTGRLNGTGSGSTTGIAENNHMFKHGRCVFRRWAKERLKKLGYCCERCGSKIDATTRGNWAGHHKDHNHTNNIIENLEVLCKRCHQIEHKCWEAFQGVTTIPEGSTLETMEAHSPAVAGDDIVCSA